MFFKENLDFNETNLDYGVLKTNNRQYLPTKLVTTSVPHSNCRLSCRASVSDIVPLKAGDRLSIQTSIAGQQFGMYKDTASFICHKVIK